MASKKRSGAPTRSGSGSSASGRTGQAKKSAAKTSTATRGSRPSSAPSGSSPLEALSALSRVTRELGLRWYLFGAQAAVLWGRARTTADVDVTVEIELSQVEELLAAARKAGLVEREKNTLQLARSARVVPLVTRSGMDVDVVLAGTGLEQTFLARARIVAIGELEIPIISPEDLIVAKLIAGRPRDIEDVRGVVEQRGRRLDVDYIEETLRDIEQQLELDGLLAQWQTLSQPHPKPGER